MATAAIYDYLPKLILTKPVRKYSLEEYLQKEENSVHKHEFINGQILKMPGAKYTHNLIASNLMTEIKIAIKESNRNFQVIGGDQKIYFPSLDDTVYADALAISEKPLFWDDNEMLLINPILVVEVLSKSTQKYNRTGKFDKYKTLESFKEYVLIRQDEGYAEVWYREKPGLWHETNITDINGKLKLDSIGIEVELSEIYRNVTFEVKGVK